MERVLGDQRIHIGKWISPQAFGDVVHQRGERVVIRKTRHSDAKRQLDAAVWWRGFHADSKQSKDRMIDQWLLVRGRVIARLQDEPLPAFQSRRKRVLFRLALVACADEIGETRGVTMANLMAAGILCTPTV